MRFLAKVSFPHEPFNGYVKDASINGKIMGILNELKPEAAYFTEMNGKRTAFFIFHMDEASQMPGIAEPFFITFGADFEWHPTMMPEDFAKANLEDIGKKLV